MSKCYGFISISIKLILEIEQKNDERKIPLTGIRKCFRLMTSIYVIVNGLIFVESDILMN